ncbi:MAG: hypothetical protein ACOYXC_16835 [Candidatus Rifleibacteriota bacterium]
MKLFSISAINNLSPGHLGKAEIVARSGERSLAIINGRPMQIATDSSGNKAAKTSESQSVASGAPPTMTPEKLLATAGLEKNQTNLQLIETLRQYGIALTAENLAKAASTAMNLPAFSQSIAARQAMALTLLRRLQPEKAALIESYFQGKLKFSSIFSGNPELTEIFREKSGIADILKRLQLMLQTRGRESGGNLEEVGEKFEGLAKSLLFQELMTEPANQHQENRVNFQWPFFWHGSELPDTLEGEAFFLNGKEQGFCLRLLVCPPSLGQIEVAMNQLEDSLWVHFGVQPEMVESIPAVFPALQEGLAGAGFAKVRLTAGRIREIESFLLEVAAEDRTIAAARVDLKI